MIKKLLIFIFVLFFLNACKLYVADNYTHEKSIDKYFNSKYKNELIKNDIKIVKCVIINKKIVPMFYDKFVVNAYNSLIYIKYINDQKGYIVYFDVSYKFNNKKQFISDLDECLKNVSVIEENRKSWN